MSILGSCWKQAKNQWCLIAATGRTLIALEKRKDKWVGVIPPNPEARIYGHPSLQRAMQQAEQYTRGKE